MGVSLSELPFGFGMEVMEVSSRKLLVWVWSPGERSGHAIRIIIATIFLVQFPNSVPMRNNGTKY
jgi:hypothetical protein